MTNLLISKRNLRLYNFATLLESDCLGYNPALTLSNYGSLKKLFGGEGDVKLRHKPRGISVYKILQEAHHCSVCRHSLPFPDPGYGILDIIIQSYLTPIICTQENIYKQLIRRVCYIMPYPLPC